MRDIKFRAWDKEEKEMIFNGIELAYKTLNAELNNHYTWIGYSKKYYEKRFEIMQLTGLLDKNDKEIYEGDICKYKFPLGGEHIGIIEFIENSCIMCFNSGRIKDNVIFGKDFGGELEIIGNIYENPELLEKICTK